MKTLLIVYSGPDARVVERLLDEHQAGGYTEVGPARGAGQTGRREGTRAWPGASTVFMSVVPSEQVEPLRAALIAARAAMAPSDRLHVVVLPTDSFI
jgi:hypothetical protein